MELSKMLKQYLNQPTPIWNTDLTDVLVPKKWNQLCVENTPVEYSIFKCITGETKEPVSKSLIAEDSKTENIYLEAPSEKLNSFYDEHGLDPLSFLEIGQYNAIPKIKAALEVLQLQNAVYQDTVKLVKSVLVIKAESIDTDISYSHPNIPFSIFFSVCESESEISNLRVAESMLHEAMHLKLTLIENEVQLVLPNTGNLYFSPWREEKRPARGVLHGLFVFKALLDFFVQIKPLSSSSAASEYLNCRVQQITKELLLLRDFALCPDLTEDGATLTKNLLPLN